MHRDLLLSASLVITVLVNYKFLLSDTESEILLQFETSPSLESLSSKIGRDITVISRQLKRISEKADVLTKVSGRWSLTDKGRRFNQATLDFIRVQRGIFSEKYYLKIGTNREFSSRCISRQIVSLQNCFKDAALEILAFEKGTEQALLSGEIDIAFDCGKPFSPEIKYTHVRKETLIPVASAAFIKKHGKVKNVSELSKLQHIYCERLKPDRVANIEWDSVNIAIQTNDIASARAMAIAGIGWALLPDYAIRTEREENLLKPILDQTILLEKYGVWRLRTRSHLEKDFISACRWLSELDF
jgi:DNA-binding transcriptional LysR family regulator